MSANNELAVTLANAVKIGGENDYTQSLKQRLDMLQSV
jgi:hypothetical protein